MKSFKLTLILIAPVFLLVGLLHLLLGPGADVLLGANLPHEVLTDPALDSQNRFFGVTLSLYGVLLFLCSTDIRKYATVLRCILWVFFAAGVARLVSIALHGLPPPMIIALLASEVLLPPVLHVWLSRALGEGYGAIRPDRKIVYTTRGVQQLTLHVFRPRNRADHSPAPALLQFHGGRWLYGRPEDMYPQCRFFAAQGFSCFAVQYRLGSSGQPDVRGALADAQCALQYLIDHAKVLFIDPRKITVIGGSAGGHLAAALGCGLPLARDTASLSTNTRPAAQVLYNPMLDLAPGTPDHHLVKDYWQEVSPRHHIDSAVPPTLILVGSQDPEVPVATVQAFCAGVHNAGGRCEIEVYEGQGHGFAHAPLYRQMTNERVLRFLRDLHL